MKVRYHGHVGRLGGYGRAGAEICLSLLASGIELEICPIDWDKDEARIALSGGYEALVPCCKRAWPKVDAEIVHTLPMDLGAAWERVVKPGATHPVVAYTTWETHSKVPTHVLDEITRGYSYDEIWVPSTSCRRAFIAGLEGFSDLPVRVMPHAFDLATLPARRAPYPLERDFFTFYYVGAWNSRKNPAGLLRAWAMAFGPDDKVLLHLQCAGAPDANFATALYQTGLRAKDMPPVMLTNGQVANDRIIELHRAGDVFVSATRGEAWDLPAFEALLAGRHIIHPAATGADDYLLDGTSADLYGGMAMPASCDVRWVQSTFPSGSGDPTGAIRTELEVVGAQGLTSRSRWIEPDLIRLAEAMRNAYLARRRDLAVRYNPADRYSHQAVGTAARQALETLCD